MGKVILISLAISIGTNIYFFYMLVNRKRSSKYYNDNNLLKDILDRASKNDTNFVDSSARFIVEVLKKYYKIDYCTIFIKNGKELKVIASDNNEIYYNNIEKHCNDLLLKVKGSAIIQSSNSYLSYESALKRKIKYSYFIKLNDIGALYIENKRKYKENNFEVEFFKIVIKNIIIILQNCLYQDKITSLAMKDNLTGIYNRNYMANHIKSIQNTKCDLVLAIMDIDHFKKVNDTYGHDFGDIVLKDVSNFIKSTLSESDEIYRWGGEEFVISFKGQDIKYVEDKLNYIKDELSSRAIIGEKFYINVTASFGVAKFEEEQSIDDVLNNADKALYISKESGRNRVTSYNTIIFKE